MEENDRVKEFVKRYGELVDELKVDFANFPMYIPDGGGGFRTIIQSQPIDIKDQPTKSPFIPEQ